MNEIHNEGILRKYDLTLKVSTMPWEITTALKEQDSSQATPVPRKDGEEIFADNLSVTGAEKSW